MPKPRTSERHDDFVQRCIPEVLEDGTAENPSQAVAICESIWEDHD